MCLVPPFIFVLWSDSCIRFADQRNWHTSSKCCHQFWFSQDSRDLFAQNRQVWSLWALGSCNQPYHSWWPVQPDNHRERACNWNQTCAQIYWQDFVCGWVSKGGSAIHHPKCTKLRTYMLLMCVLFSVPHLSYVVLYVSVHAPAVCLRLSHTSDICCLCVSEILLHVYTVLFSVITPFLRDFIMFHTLLFVHFFSFSCHLIGGHSVFILSLVFFPFLHTTTLPWRGILWQSKLLWL